jgi:hypothetical protein
MNAQGDGQGHGQPRPTTPADNEMAPEGEPRESEQAFVQTTQPPSPPAMSHEEFVRQLDEGGRAPERQEDEQPPGFRPDF